MAESYIKFVEAPPKPKTKVWHVLVAESDELLGHVSWFGRWRCYAFSPLPGTLFERHCLRDIADFCERMTKEHRAKAA